MPRRTALRISPEALTLVTIKAPLASRGRRWHGGDRASGSGTGSATQPRVRSSCHLESFQDKHDQKQKVYLEAQEWGPLLTKSWPLGPPAPAEWERRV